MISMSGRKQVKIPESKKLVKNFTQGIPCPDCGCRHWDNPHTRRVGAKFIHHRKCRNCGRKVRCEDRLIEDTDSGSI